jgi:hypothetical protein
MAYPAGQVVPFMNQTLYNRFFQNPPLNVSQDWGGDPSAATTGYNGLIRPLLPGANIPGQLR